MALVKVLIVIFFCPAQIQQLHDTEEVCYNKVLEQVKAGHQVRYLLYIYPQYIAFKGDVSCTYPGPYFYSRALLE